MNSGGYAKTWHRLMGQRRNLLDRRTNLETELIEIRNELAHLTEAMNHIAPLAGLEYTDDDDIPTLGITDAIRSILKNSKEDRLSAQDVKTQLQEKGYDLSSLSAPMASIYKILSRLVDDSGEVEREREEGRVYYKWKMKITDDDIPF